MELRALAPCDVQAVARYALDGMRAELYPLEPDVPRIEAVVASFLAPLDDRFGRLALDAGRLVGAIAALVVPMPWFKGDEAHVVMCRATLPGAGVRLIRALREWVDQRDAIRRVIWPMEFHADPRIARLAARAGFDNTLTVCTYYKER